MKESKIKFLNQKLISNYYHYFYQFICGSGTNLRFWHFQYLSNYYQKKCLFEIAPHFSGQILDVGCGDKPYEEFFTNVSSYHGIDIIPGPKVDCVIEVDKKFPIGDNFCDVLLSTQVLEHIANIELTLQEILRVTKTGGLIILCFPFIFNVHGEPNDFRRFTKFGANNIFQDHEIVLSESQGGIGSTLAILFLNWIVISLSKNIYTKIIKVLILPFFLILTTLVNLLGFFLNAFDKTDSFYSNVLVIFKKV